ncbi:uroporphyrinogen-III synthase [Arthrobacter sp. ISL-5]|uniref:uroporphyrinogen-III synthase n=1 Tax=Arthrobacter sp. ISL-5 TaxID=2819111 RepID=UPI001BEC0DBA|nr:uroporphyrinogen-III synthase [Arthrobacter sp. ISL-5]MBT2554375.1 uroporphyrinogen-III synthase [Arthrobacter sp. ISL-5]
MGQTNRQGPEGNPAGRPDARRPLEGARILITRSPDRAEALAAELRLAGAEPLVLPLTDAERARDQGALDDAFDALGAGHFAWLVVSSATTVLALTEKAAERSVALSEWIPLSTRVAAVGPATRSALQSAGVTVHFVPEQEHSAAGLTAEWPGGPGEVLLPQADIAAPALAHGLEAKGARVRTVVAYHTVDYPAAPDRRLAPAINASAIYAGVGSANGVLPVLTPDAARGAVSSGELAAVVAASPSAARRISAELAPLGACRVVAIGKATAAEAEARGLTVAATARESTPEGLVAAIIRALHPQAGDAPAGSRIPDIHSSAPGTQ